MAILNMRNFAAAGGSLWAALLLALVATRSCAAVPNGFIEEGVVSVIAITGAFAPNPRNGGKPMLLLSSKEGKIHVLEDPDNSDRDMQIGDLSQKICSNGERGLQTILPHPNFAQNRFLFMYYTKGVSGCPEDVKTGPPNRLSRFTVNIDTLNIDMNSEKVFFETPPAPKRMHNGGAMAFGNDGLLYVLTGDAGSRPHYSPDLRNLYGKVLRLDVDKSNIVPGGNPFSSRGVSCAQSGGRPPSGSASDAVCSEIYAYGLRNPFRLAMDVNTRDKVRFAIGDVGASVWEEISLGGTDFAGTNYAWPDYEGPCKNGSTKDCAKPGKGITDPFYYYQHTKSAEGGAVVGGAFVPEGLWPSNYKYLFIDFVFKKMFNLVEDKGRECRTCTPPIPGYRNETFHSHDDMVDMFFGPYKNTKALYVVSRSSGQNVRRIRYTGSSNRAPVAVIKPSATRINPNGKIVFDGSGSSDQDGDSLKFEWNFGDGGTSTEKSPTHTFTKEGEFMVTLTVTDTKSQNNQAFVNIVVGTPPKATMTSPALNSQFKVGQKLRLVGSATESDGRPLAASQIFWEVRQHHAAHFHPFLDRTAGNDFDLQAAPEPEDFIAATNSYLEVIMYAVDSNGVTTTISRNVKPKLVAVDFDTTPRGLKVVADETVLTTPTTITTWENHNLRLNVNDQSPNNFVSWSISGNRQTIFKVPAAGSTNAKVTATFSGSNTPIVAPKAAPVRVPSVGAPTSGLEAIPLIGKVRQCTSGNKCGRCEGHCSSNNDCQGGLVCFQKNEGKPGVDAVPGCLGQDLSKTDWCTLPTTIPVPTPVVVNQPTAPVRAPSSTGTVPAIPLVKPVRQCTASNPCGRCEGNCLSDNDCRGELVCFLKAEGKPGVNAAPGCIGQDLSRTDWCVLPTSLQVPVPTPKALPVNIPPLVVPVASVPAIPLVEKVRKCTTSDQCKRCEGHCSSDGDCQGDLVCFQKVDGNPSVPGCIGKDFSRTDWCTSGKPTPVASPVLQQQSPSVIAIPLNRKVRECNSRDPCGQCEGNCADDDDCEGSLICFQKGVAQPGVDAVPGCIGQDLSRTDWCIAPSNEDRLHRWLRAPA